MQSDVVSISYGALEFGLDQGTMYSFSVEAMKLTLTGVTIIAARYGNVLGLEFIFWIFLSLSIPYPLLHPYPIPHT